MQPSMPQAVSTLQHAHFLHVDRHEYDSCFSWFFYTHACPIRPQSLASLVFFTTVLGCQVHKPHPDHRETSDIQMWRHSLLALVLVSLAARSHQHAYLLYPPSRSAAFGIMGTLLRQPAGLHFTCLHSLRLQELPSLHHSARHREVLLVGARGQHYGSIGRFELQCLLNFFFCVHVQGPVCGLHMPHWLAWRCSVMTLLCTAYYAATAVACKLSHVACYE